MEGFFVLVMNKGKEEHNPPTPRVMNNEEKIIKLAHSLRQGKNSATSFQHQTFVRILTCSL